MSVGHRGLLWSWCQVPARRLIRAAPNSVAISLGPRILRAETAALAALASFMAVAGDWRS